MIGKLCVLALTAVFLTVDTARAADNPSLCSDDAQVVFSCPSTGGTISVCKIGGVSNSQSSLIYRFGRSTDTSFSLSARTKLDNRVVPSSSPRVLARILLYSGGGGAYLRFINGKTDYVVFSTFINGSESRGVAVNKNGKTSFIKYCIKTAVSTMNLRLFKELGVTDDPDEFVLPQKMQRTP